VAVGVSVMLVFALLALGLIGAGKSDRNWTHHHSTQSPGAAELHEVLVRDSPFEDKVAVISLEGVISGEVLSDIGSSLVELVSDQLERAAVEGVSAVILKVDSPGGEVLASDEIYLLL
jgi:protease-4